MDSNADSFSRRQFLTASLGVFAASSLASNHTFSAIPNSPAITAQDVINTIIKAVPSGTRQETVDTIKSGNGSQEVTGIATTMFATIDVIQKAIQANANFIIAHEPTFYSHLDETTWLESHDVYKHKRDLLEKNKIVVWRFHDYIHAFRPDGILMGVLESLQWEKYYNAEEPQIIRLPPTELNELIGHVKDRLGIDTLRYIGSSNQQCEKIALLPGAWGGRMQISSLQTHRPDVLICGEIAEWETSEYIRDARAMGREQSLIVLGHAVSEEPGMRWFVKWLQPKFPSLKITHLPSGSPFSWA